MDLQTRLTEDMKTAMKSGQKDRLSVIRMVLSDVKNIDLMPNKPTAEQVVEAYAKKLRKSAEEYEKVGRPDEAAKLKSEIAIVEEYLPKKASAADTERLVDDFLAKNSFGEKRRRTVEQPSCPSSGTRSRRKVSSTGTSRKGVQRKSRTP